MKIRKATEKDMKASARLVAQTFAKFNNKECTKEGLEFYLNHHRTDKTPQEFREAFLRYTIFFVAEDKEKIIGLVRGTKERLFNLFVDGKYHRKGIAKKLMGRFEMQARKMGSTSISTKASSYAVPFYQKMGYKKTTGLRQFNGIKVQPMRKLI